MEVKWKRGMKNWRFRHISRFISKKAQDTAIVTMEDDSYAICRIIIINDSIYPVVSKASRTGNKRSVVSRTIVQTDESLGAA